MKRKATAGFTLVELMIVITILVALMALVAMGVSGIRERTRKLDCSKKQSDLVTAMIGYEQRYNSYPKQNGKLLFTWLYLVGDVQKIELLKCPGNGANKDRLPEVKQLIFIRGNRTTEELENDFLKSWPKNTISYWGASGDSENSNVQGRYTLDRLINPTDEDRQQFLDDELTHDNSNIPLISDDNDTPKNHKNVIIFTFADKSSREIENSWDDAKYPFAAMSSGE